MRKGHKRIEKYINPGETFCFTYGDGVGDVNITDVIKNHKSSKKLATVTAVNPPGRFGVLDIDESGNVVSWSSAGAKGFKGSRKSTPYAAQVAADDAGSKAFEQGLRTLTVQVKGPGSGRETALRSLQSIGFKILSIKDTTPMPHNGARPPKRRRV